MPDNKHEPKIVMYGTEFCSYCAAARLLLKKKGLDFEDILVSRDDDKRREMERLSGRNTVPQIFIDDEPIGGFDELYSLEQDGRLDQILGRSAVAQHQSSETSGPTPVIKQSRE